MRSASRLSDAYFAIEGAILFQSKVQQERPQGQSLEHERAEYGTEGSDEDQVAVRKLGGSLGRRGHAKGSELLSAAF